MTEKEAKPAQDMTPEEYKMAKKQALALDKPWSPTIKKTDKSCLEMTPAEFLAFKKANR